MKHLKLFENFNDSKIDLHPDDVFDCPEIDHVITVEEERILNDYFKDLESDIVEMGDGETGETYRDVEYANMTIREAGKLNPDFELEEIAHILCALYPEKYNGIY